MCILCSQRQLLSKEADSLQQQLAHEIELGRAWLRAQRARLRLQREEAEKEQRQHLALRPDSTVDTRDNPFPDLHFKTTTGPNAGPKPNPNSLTPNPNARSDPNVSSRTYPSPDSDPAFSLHPSSQLNADPGPKPTSSSKPKPRPDQTPLSKRIPDLFDNLYDDLYSDFTETLNASLASRTGSKYTPGVASNPKTPPRAAPYPSWNSSTPDPYTRSSANDSSPRLDASQTSKHGSGGQHITSTHALGRKGSGKVQSSTPRPENTAAAMHKVLFCWALLLHGPVRGGDQRTYRWCGPCQSCISALVVLLSDASQGTPRKQPRKPHGSYKGGGCPRTPQGRGLRPARREVPATGVATGP